MAGNLSEAVERIRARGGAYREEAYFFLLESLDFTIRQLEQPRHVTGGELLDGLRRFALSRFGPTTRMVFEHWGVNSTEDWGRIVFDLIEHGVLAKTETDRLADFVDVFDFKKVFEDDYRWTPD